MRQYNWSIYATSELSTQFDSKSAFFFRFDPTRLNNPPLCISFNEYDKIRVIDGTQNHVNAVLNAIQSSWPEGIQKLGSYSLSHQFKLGGYPFSDEFSSSLYTAVVVMFIISNLQTQGAKFLYLYVSIFIPRLFRVNSLPPNVEKSIIFELHLDFELTLFPRDLEYKTKINIDFIFKLFNFITIHHDPLMFEKMVHLLIFPHYKNSFLFFHSMNGYCCHFWFQNRLNAVLRGFLFNVKTFWKEPIKLTILFEFNFPL
jgi:hypothetical protein